MEEKTMQEIIRENHIKTVERNKNLYRLQQEKEKKEKRIINTLIIITFILTIIMFIKTNEKFMKDCAKSGNSKQVCERGNI